MFITVTMSKANRFNDIYKDNYNDGIKQGDDCYKFLLNWCTTEHPSQCGPKSNKQTCLVVFWRNCTDIWQVTAELHRNWVGPHSALLGQCG